MKSCVQHSLLYCTLFLFYPLFFLCIPASASDQAITISVPGEILKEVIRDALPIPLETPENYLKGEIVIDSLSDLRVEENSIFLSGIVLGRNLAMTTRIADRDISVKLGSVRLPVTCELVPRFDKAKQILYITPYFSKTGNEKNADIADALITLLAAFNDREYPLEMDSLEPLMVRAGKRDIPVKLEPVDVQLEKGTLVVKLMPRVLVTQQSAKNIER